jgi:tRNA (adenine37-N6)-methyltransferase
MEPEERRCCQCGRSCPQKDCKTVDGQVICHECLFGTTKGLRFYPIGVVENEQRKKGTFGLDTKGVSRLVLSPGMARFMNRVEEESHLTVVWYTHDPGPLVTTFPRRWDGKEVGPFAARTPNRPNGIAITEVEVIGRENNVIHVRGLDAIDGTPILDIKASMESLRRTPKKPLRDDE